MDGRSAVNKPITEGKQQPKSASEDLWHYLFTLHLLEVT
jgi:hypothetical protein